MDLYLPFNFLLTEELKRCDDPCKDAVNCCLRAALIDIVTDAIYYTGRHNARTVIKETDIKLAIALYLRKMEHSIEYSHWFDKEQFLVSGGDDCSDSEPDSDALEESDQFDDSSGSDDESGDGAASSDGSPHSDERQYKSYSWENVYYKEHSDVSECESSASLDSECEDYFRRPEEIATETRWLYNVNYDAVRALVWAESAAHLDELTQYLSELLELLKLKMQPHDGLHVQISTGFEQSLSFDSVAVILPLLCFLTWNATLAMRGDRRSPFMHAFFGQRRHFVVFLAESGMHKIGSFASPNAPAGTSLNSASNVLSASTAAEAANGSGPLDSFCSPLSYLSKPRYTHAKVKLFNNYGCAMGSAEVTGSDATHVVLDNDEVFEITIKRIEIVRKVSHRNEAVGTVFRNPSLCNYIMMYIPAYMPYDEETFNVDTQSQPAENAVGEVIVMDVEA